MVNSGCLAMYSETPVVGDHSGSRVDGPAVSLRRWWRVEVDLERFLLPAPAHFLRTSTLTSRWLSASGTTRPGFSEVPSFQFRSASGLLLG